MKQYRVDFGNSTLDVWANDILHLLKVLVVVYGQEAVEEIELIKKIDEK